MGLRAINNPKSSFEDPYASTGTEAWAPYVLPSKWYGTRGTWCGGVGSNVIDYVTISSTANATDFGDMIASYYGPGGVSNGTLAVLGGGRNGGTRYNTMQYVTFDTLGNATDIGNLTESRFGTAAFSNATRGVWAGGFTASAYTGTMDYFDIATSGGATDFGDLNLGARVNAGGCANATRGIIYSGYTGSDNYISKIGYITMSTPGNSTTFGDPLPSQGVAHPAGCSGD